MQYAFYSAKQVADLAGCAKITVLKQLQARKIHSFRLSNFGRDRAGKYVVPASEAARWASEYRMRQTL
jgi:hypothetical protein